MEIITEKRLPKAGKKSIMKGIEKGEYYVIEFIG